MTATIHEFRINPALEPISLDELVAIARRFASAAGCPRADNPYQVEIIRRIDRATEAARYSGAVTEYAEGAEIFDMTKFLDD